jgi:hypothetical protein
MARLDQSFWLFFLVSSAAFADQNNSVKSKLDPVGVPRSGDKVRIPADETGVLLADEHGTLIVDERGERALADQESTKVLADEHGTLALITQQPLADRRGSLIWDIVADSRRPEPK